jgi:hypothetical protein
MKVWISRDKGSQENIIYIWYVSKKPVKQTPDGCVTFSIEDNMAHPEKFTDMYYPDFQKLFKINLTPGTCNRYNIPKITKAK